MDINSLDQLLAQPDLNPLKLVGVESWVIKSMGPRSLRNFLVDFRKVIAKYHHPDLFQEPRERDLHGQYFQRVSSAIDLLLEDNYEFEKAIAEFKSGNFSAQQKHLDLISARLEAKEREYLRLEKETNSLRTRVKDINLTWTELRKSALHLANSEGAIRLDAYTKATLLYADLNYLDTFSNNFELGLFRNIKKILKCSLSIEDKEDALTEAIKHEVNLQFKEPGREGKDDRLAFHRGRLDGQSLVGINKNGTPEQEFEVVGSVPLSAIASLQRLHPTDQVQNILKHQLSFMEEGSYLEERADENAAHVVDFMRPFTPVLVKRIKERKRTHHPEYSLFVMTDINPLKNSVLGGKLGAKPLNQEKKGKSKNL